MKRVREWPVRWKVLSLPVLLLRIVSYLYRRELCDLRVPENGSSRISMYSDNFLDTFFNVTPSSAMYISRARIDAVLQSTNQISSFGECRRSRLYLQQSCGPERCNSIFASKARFLVQFLSSNWFSFMMNAVVKCLTPITVSTFVRWKSSGLGATMLAYRWISWTAALAYGIVALSAILATRSLSMWALISRRNFS